MTTPFGGDPPVTNIPLIESLSTTGLPVASEHNRSFATGTTQMFIGVSMDWSKIKSSAVYFNIVWGHDATSTATPGSRIYLYDWTNNSLLATASSNTTADISALSTFLATTITFTKPSGVAQLSLQAQNGDTTGRVFYILDCRLVFI